MASTMSSGPAPKDPATRARRNKPPTSGMTLPREGRTTPAPDWPIECGEPSLVESAVWTDLWATPQAVAWEHTAAVSESFVARYVRLLCSDMSDPRIWPEVRQMEDRLGLNPLSMRRLGWELEKEEAQSARQASESASPAGGARERYAHLRAVAK